jgi:transposase
MTQRQNYKLNINQRRNRFFGEEFKKRKVEELDRKLVTIPEICKEYEVSRTSVWRWIYQYSGMRKKGEKIRLESESDTRKLLELQEKVKELERIIGQKQLMIDFQEKMIELAEERYKVDIKKKLNEKLSSGTGTTENDTAQK